jgi:hypothetical protein
LAFAEIDSNVGESCSSISSSFSSAAFIDLCTAWTRLEGIHVQVLVDNRATQSAMMTDCASALLASAQLPRCPLPRCPLLAPRERRAKGQNFATNLGRYATNSLDVLCDGVSDLRGLCIFFSPVDLDFWTLPVGALRSLPYLFPFSVRQNLWRRARLEPVQCSNYAPTSIRSSKQTIRLFFSRKATQSIYLATCLNYM